MSARGAARGVVVRGVLVALGLCLGSSPASASDGAQAPSGRAAPAQTPSGRAAPAQTPSGRAAPAQAPSGRAAPAQTPSGRAAPAQAPSGRAPQTHSGHAAPAQTHSGRAAQAPRRQAAPAQSVGQQSASITRVENPARRRLIIAGAATAGGFWTASAISAAALALKRQERAQATCTQVACFPAAVLAARSARAQSPAPLLIPLVGPWIHLGTTRPSAAGAVGLSVLGIGQAVGFGMLLGGLAMEKEVRVPGARVIQMSAGPVLRPDAFGLSIQGSM